VVDPVRERRPVEMVTAPVRIADGATVRLLRPGDRVDVVAAAESAVGGGDAQVVARGARVTKVPESPDGTDSVTEGGALVVLSVPRTTATRLAGAGATSRLAVTLC
jgi:Flp pilus assembly protein CpaB